MRRQGWCSRKTKTFRLRIHIIGSLFLSTVAFRQAIPRTPKAFYQIKSRTVVLIHIRQATLAPMATAPAVPPRRALAPAFDMTSRKLKGSFFPLLSALIVITAEDTGYWCFNGKTIIIVPVVISQSRRRHYPRVANSSCRFRILNRQMNDVK